MIDDVSECTVKEHVGVGSNCPELVAMCDGESGARCQDEIGRIRANVGLIMAVAECNATQ